jgi:hypothetical protein
VARKAVFSEGRTPCVREYGPDASRGIPFPPDDEARGRLAYRAHVSARPMPPLRACGARPSRGEPRTDGLAGKGRIWREESILRRDALCASGRIGPRACRGMASRTSSALPRQVVPTFFSTRRAALGYI